ncbi:hypothetical protein [Streptomyces sp. HUAS TT20]|uniref:hypothetical protein n=1 Tax=Streptomyces sp. HUAS TT20 TaxID=3447509 RepID=UPI0021DB4EA2|nr:hypothetical protein [Streptomyces sp. HUAS 15-9]UXY26498.1 hypothetical protein N8I87_07880 [Streptomyces sp. HUAS 15-9]
MRSAQRRRAPYQRRPAGPGLLTAPATAAPTAALAFAPYDADTPPPRDGAVPLPLLEPGPKWLAHRAGLVADPGGGRTPGAVAWLPPKPTPDAEPAPDITSRAVLVYVLKAPPAQRFDGAATQPTRA